MSEQSIEAAPGSGSSEIMARLRSATSDHHDRAEGRELQQALVRGVLPRGTYAAYLAELLHVHRRLEGRIREAAASHRSLNAVYQPHCERESDLRADLAFYGRQEEPPASATRALLDEIDGWAAANPIALLGPLYVLEGSMNGNVFIARVLMKVWGMAPGPGLHYLNPYGSDQRAVWAEFKERMNDQPLSREDQDAVIAAAQRTFDGIAAIADEVHGA